MANTENRQMISFQEKIRPAMVLEIAYLFVRVLIMAGRMPPAVESNVM